MSDPLDELDYYTLLGVADDADEAAIQQAFRAFARKYHPDRFGDAAEEKRARATAIYRRGAEGVQVLADPAARRLYDVALKQGVRRLTAEQRENAVRLLDRPRAPDHGAPPGRAGAAALSLAARAYWDRAVTLSREGDYTEARRMMHAALGEEPGNAFLLDQLARLDAFLRTQRR